jgi:hypothetical protein
MPRRQPRWPSIGLNSCRLLTLVRARARRPTLSSASPRLDLWASSLCGRNSCSGGSSRRMVTGRPFHGLEDALEVAALHGQQLGQGASRAGLVSARIISRTARMRSGLEEHVLGAAEADALGAEARATGRLRACRRWCGPGACGPCRPRASARRKLARRAPGPGTVGARPSMTSPVEPSMVMSRLRARRAADPHRAAARSRSRAPSSRRRRALPMPRATTAAWEVMPPARSGCPARRACRRCPRARSRRADQDDLRSPLARGLGLVRRRTRPRPPPRPARPAGRGRSRAALGSWDRASGAGADRAAFGVDAQDRLFLRDEPSLAMSTAMRTAAAGALAVAGLEHPELAGLDGELDVLHVAVVRSRRL